MKPVDPVDSESGQQGVISDNGEKIESRKHGRALFPAGLILLFAGVSLAPHALRSSGTPGLLLLYGLALAGWLICSRSRFAPSIGMLVLVSIAARIIPLLAPPELSHDVYRYLWDGKVSASGINPYLYAPASPSLESLREQWHPKINHPEIRSIYPPAAQGAFALAAIAGMGLAGWKALLVLADLATILMIAHLADRRRALLYALFPLVIIEGIWSAHADILASLFLVACLVSLRKGKSLQTGIAAAIAASIKIVPLAALPALIGGATRKYRLVAGFAITAVVLFAPYAARGPVMPGLTDYAQRWSFNSPVYASTVWLVESSHLPRILANGWTILKDVARLEAISGPIYRILNAETIARGLMAGLLICLLIIVLTRIRRKEASIAASLGVLLLCSPTVHPWYWLVLLPFAMMANTRLWMALAAASPLSYLLYEGAEPMLVFALCYFLPAAAVILSRRGKKERALAARKPAAGMREELPSARANAP